MERSSSNTVSVTYLLSEPNWPLLGHKLWNAFPFVEWWQCLQPSSISHVTISYVLLSSSGWVTDQIMRRCWPAPSREVTFNPVDEVFDLFSTCWPSISKCSWLHMSFLRVSVGSATVISPLELIRTNMQSEKQSYRELSAVIRSALHSEGWRSLWRGWGPTLLRDVPFSGQTLTAFILQTSHFEALDL